MWSVRDRTFARPIVQPVRAPTNAAPHRALSTLSSQPLIMAQKALIVTRSDTSTEGLDALNEALAAGWRVVHATPMGGAGAGRPPEAALQFAALVVIEQADEQEMVAAAAVEEAEEEVDELLGEIVEGNGAGSEPGLDAP